ncbi:MAG TPA: hypothetical protein DCY27_04360 [Desulfobacterales bacterium]|nr:hypothetical protein [Desulfobacterales bacterium]
MQNGHRSYLELQWSSGTTLDWNWWSVNTDQIEADLAALRKVINPGDPGGGIDDTNIVNGGITASTKLVNLSVTAEKIADGAATDAKIGNRTVDPLLAPASSTGTLTQILSWLSNRIRAITGKTNWYDNPATTLEAANTHYSATTGVHGVGASTVESAAGAQSKVDTHNALTDPHSATSLATANRIVLRDAFGRAKVAAPAASDDIAQKAQADAVQTNLTTHQGAATLDHPDGSVTEAKIAANAATDVKIGNRTVDQVQAPTGNTGNLTQLLSWIVNRIKDIKGTTNWYDASPDFVNVTGDTMSGDLEFQTNKAKFGSGKFSIDYDGTNNALRFTYTP